MSVTFSDAMTAATALERIVVLPDDWDSHGAPAISEAMITGARKLLGRFVVAGFPTPAVSPTTRGGIVFTWRAPGLDLGIEMDPKSGQLTAGVSWSGG